MVDETVRRWDHVSRRRGVCAAVFLAGLATVFALELSGQERSPPLQQPAWSTLHGQLFRDALVAWSEGSGTEAVDMLIELWWLSGEELPGALIERQLRSIPVETLIPVLGLFEALHTSEVGRAIEDSDPEWLTVATAVRSALARQEKMFLERVKHEGNADLGLDPQQAARIASRMRTSLALTLLGAGDVEMASRQLDRALQLDPRSAGALLGSAAIEEKMSRYRPAAGFLQRLLAIEPEHGEARLRLALARLRIGRRSEAAELLDAASRETSPAWVRVVAFQELAQARAAEGDLEAASSVARRGSAAFPDDEALALLLLWLLGDRSEESAVLLEALTERRDDTVETIEITPRVIYNLWPADTRDAVAGWRRDVDSRLPLLARALK